MEDELTNSGQRDTLADQQHTSTIHEAGSGGEQVIIIWTPTFITLFALVLVVGLSMITILIQGWLNGYYAGTTVLLGYLPPIVFLWIAVLVKARSAWVQAGAAFGCLWSLFTAGNFWLTSLVAAPQTSSIAQMNMATNSALLGMSICLSLAHTPFQRWDNWFFRFLPLLVIALPVAEYLRIPKDAEAFSLIESFSATLLLYLSCAVWWLRPSCWRYQPGPAFLFGIAPLILLVFVMPNLVGREQVFLFQQIFLLCILLGAMRVLQGELQR